MADLPLVSVLVTARGAAEGLAVSLESALAQDYPVERLELVDVHDGTEAVAQVVAGYAQVFPHRVRAIAQPGADALALTARALYADALGEVWKSTRPCARGSRRARTRC